MGTRIAPEISFEARAYQAFVLGLKLYWTNELYRDVANQAQRLGLDDPRSIEREMCASTTYQYFGWLEHYLQQYKYLGRWGMLRVLEPQDASLAAALEQAAERDPERLQLDPKFELPRYYVLDDFHQHPGGIWSDPCDAFMYEWAAGSTTPTLTDHADLHVRLARYIRDRFHPRSILDVGCGFGKTTLPLKQEMPEADVVGCDLSVPVLRLGHLRAVERDLEINWVQRASEDLRFPAERFDVVTSTMLLHELPQSAVRRSLAEARRVLRPGGAVVHLDFYDVPGGATGEFLHLGHSARNREPYMRTLLQMDLQQDLRDAGFDEVRIERFEEEDGALVNGDGLPPHWRFPWTLIVGRAWP